MIKLNVIKFNSCKGINETCVETDKKRYSLKKVVFICLSSYLLILAAYMTTYYLLYAAAILLLAGIILSKNAEEALLYFVFIIPFNGDLWYPSGIGLYTVIKLSAYTIILLKSLSGVKFSAGFIISLSLFVIYICLNDIYNIGFSFEVVINLALTYLIIFLILKKSKDISIYNLSIVFSFGLLASSVMAFLADYVPNIETLMDELLQTSDMALGYTRFYGMANDPNFYSACVAVGVSSLLSVIFYQNLKSKSRLFCWIMVCLLSGFGLLSLSKAFFVVFCFIYIVFLLGVLFKQGYKSSKKIKILFVFIILAFLVILIFNDAIMQVIDRINDSNGDLNSLSTNRLSLLTKYFDAMDSFNITLFGSGINGVRPTTSTPHNLIMYLLYFLGITGTLLFAFLIFTLIFIYNPDKSKRYGIIKFLPGACLFLFCLAIDLFISYDTILILLVLSILSLYNWGKGGKNGS